MITVRPEELTLIDARSPDDPTLRARFNWLLSAVNGTASTAAIYGEIEPGCRLLTHMDGAEEVVLILEGRVDLTVGDEHRQVEAGGIAVVPALVPHSLCNAGSSLVRFIGFFPSATVASIFPMPSGPQVLGTPNWMQMLNVSVPHASPQ